MQSKIAPWRVVFVVAWLAGTGCHTLPVFGEDDAATFETRGVEALYMSQTESGAIVTAAVQFSKASAAYEAAGNETKATEMNSFLYWCKKKMTLQQCDEFVSGKTPEAQSVGKKLADVGVAPPAVDAAAFLSRAEEFARLHPNDHLLIAVRYFEVADRFRGTDESLTAQDRSLREMQLAAKTLPARAVESNPVKAKAAPVERLPLPSSAQLKQAEAEIRKLFKDEYAKPQPEQKLALAQALMRTATDTRGNDPQRCALLRETRELALGAGDLQLALKATDAIAAGFVINALEERLAILQKFAEQKRAKESAITLGDAAMKTLDDAQAAMEFRLIPALCTLAEQATGRAGDPAYLAAVKEKTAAAKAAMREGLALSAALEKLKSAPHDAAANATIGRFYCLVRNDWARGLPALAKGSDANLKAAAEKELQQPADSAAKVSVADAWWALSEAANGATKKAFSEHAAEWYALALPELTGLAKIRIEKRLGSVRASGGAPDLLPLINPKHDTVRGTWTVVPAGLRCEGAGSSRIQIPYYPADEYDLAVQFTCENRNSNGDVTFVVRLAERHVLIHLCGFRNGIAGLSWIDDNNADKNITRTPNSIEPGRKYAMLAEVRKDALRVHLDGRILFEFKTNGGKLTCKEEWRLHDERVCALGAFDDPVIFHSVSITDVNGKGESALERRHSMRIGGLGGAYFEEMPKECVLVGFKVSAKNGAKDYIDSIQPVYLNAEGKSVNGNLYGTVRGPLHELVAKPGYAVGGFNARSGVWLDAFQVVFMKMGTLLDPSDTYTSEWVGGQGGAHREVRVSGRVFGVHGRKGANVDCLGLIYKP